MKDLSPILQTVFQYAAFREKPKEPYYVQRFWIIKNKDDYQKMIDYVSIIDLVVHPPIKVYPCIFELTNDRGPLLTEVSPLYLKQKLEAAKEYSAKIEKSFLESFK